MKLCVHLWYNDLINMEAIPPFNLKRRIWCPVNGSFYWAMSLFFKPTLLFRNENVIV